ncbi:hypothetical protein LINGRAHAP2_LOCUS13415, partial [Linum grandiflorum]
MHKLEQTRANRIHDLSLRNFIPLSVPKVDGIIPPRIERIFLTGVAVLQTPVNDERNNTV